MTPAMKAAEEAMERALGDIPAHWTNAALLREALALIRAEAAAVPAEPPTGKGVSWPVAWNIGFTEGYAEAYEKYGPAAVPADREALARRLRARADELGTAYADDKAMLVEAAAIIRLRSWEEAIGRRSPEGSDNF